MADLSGTDNDQTDTKSEDCSVITDPEGPELLSDDYSESGAEDPDLPDIPSVVHVPEALKSELWSLLQALVPGIKQRPGFTVNEVNQYLQKSVFSDLIVNVATPRMFQSVMSGMVQLASSVRPQAAEVPESSAPHTDHGADDHDMREISLNEFIQVVVKPLLDGLPAGMMDQMQTLFECDRSALGSLLETKMPLVADMLSQMLPMMQRELEHYPELDMDCLHISLTGCDFYQNQLLDELEACCRESEVSAVLPSTSSTSVFSSLASVSSELYQFIAPIITDPVSDDRLRELGVPKVLREDRYFWLHLTSLLYIDSYYERYLLDWSKRIEVERMLAPRGLATLSDNQIPSMTKIVKTSRKMRRGLFKCKLSPLCLEDYMDSVTRACDISWNVMLHQVDVDVEAAQMRWDNVLENIMESLTLLRRRDQTCPAWNTIAPDIAEIIPGSAESSNAFLSEICVLGHLLYVRFNLTPEQARRLCDRYQFHCRYLDDELKNMARYVLQSGCTPDPVSSIANQCMMDELELCEFALSSFYRLVSPTTRICLSRLYRYCIENEEYDLADRLIKLRFTEWGGTDQSNLLEELTVILRNSNTRLQGIKLNGDSGSVDTNYVLPVLKSETVISSHDIPDFMKGIISKVTAAHERNLTTRVPPADCPEGGVSQARRGASTTLPPLSPSASQQWLDSLTHEEWSAWNRGENLDKNRKLTKQLRDTRCMTDLEFISICYELPFVELDLKDAITCSWTDESGSVCLRKTNLLESGIYHCLTCSYDPESGTWSLVSDFCKVGKKMKVEKKGAFREPVTGSLGSHAFLETVEHGLVFKLRRDIYDHRLSRYIHAVKTQAIACYYAQRFQAATKGRFGKVVMLNVSLVLVFDNSERGTVIDFMNAERNMGGSFDKFTNNCVWKNRYKNTEFHEAFSHFTYQDSGDLLMVTDLQGWVSSEHGLVFILTDPIIHCGVENQMPIRTFSHLENEGIRGIKFFFKYVHPKCNRICRFLKLRRHEFDGWRWWRWVVRVPGRRKRNKMLVSRPKITKVDFTKSFRKVLKPVVPEKQSPESQEDWETEPDSDSCGNERQNNVPRALISRPKSIIVDFTKLFRKVSKPLVPEKQSPESQEEWETEPDSDSCGNERQNNVQQAPKSTKIGPKKIGKIKPVMVDQNSASQDTSQEWMSGFKSDSSMD